MVPIVDLLSPVKYSPAGKYDNRYFLLCLMNLVLNSVSWRKYEGSPLNPIGGKYLNQIHNRYKRDGVYKAINKQILNRYLKKGKEEKLRYQIIDSSFVANKGGSVKKNNHLLSDRAKNKNKKIQEMNKKLPKNEQKRLESFIDFNRYNGKFVAKATNLSISKIIKFASRI